MHARKRVFYHFIVHLLSFVIIVIVTVSVVHCYNDEESEGSSDDEDTRDMEGRTFTEAGMEVKFLIMLIISCSHLISASRLTQISSSFISD